MFIFSYLERHNGRPMYLSAMEPRTDKGRDSDWWISWSWDKNNAMRISTETRAWQYYEILMKHSMFKKTITFNPVAPRIVECFDVDNYDRAMGVL